MPGVSYWWYKAKQNSYGEYMSYFHKGVKYLLFVTEPSELTISELGLTYIGKGDINYIKKGRVTNE